MYINGNYFLFLYFLLHLIQRIAINVQSSIEKHLRWKYGGVNL